MVKVEIGGKGIEISDKIYLYGATIDLSNQDLYSINTLSASMGIFSGSLGVGVTTPTAKLDVNGDINVNNYKVINLADPTDLGDAVNKNFLKNKVTVTMAVTLPIHAISDSPWSTNSDTPEVIDWTYANLYDYLQNFFTDLNNAQMIGARLVAQIAVSGGTGYLRLWDYSGSAEVVRISTTASVKSNREWSDMFSIYQGTVYRLEAWNEPGGIGNNTYVGQVALVAYFKVNLDVP